MADILYLKLNQTANVTSRKVRIGDLADVTCRDDSVCSRVMDITVTTMPDLKNNKEKKACVVSVIMVINCIQKLFPEIMVEAFGSPEVLIKYTAHHTQNKVARFFKILAVCVITFIGSSYAIIAYNNDVGMPEIFSKVYELSGAQWASDSRLIEVGYAIGLFVGIVIFYDHFAGHRISKAPTPVEVAMEQYDTDLDNAVVKRIKDREKDGK